MANDNIQFEGSSPESSGAKPEVLIYCLGAILVCCLLPLLLVTFIPAIGSFLYTIGGGPENSVTTWVKQHLGLNGGSSFNLTLDPSKCSELNGFDSDVIKAANTFGNKYGVNPALVLAIITQESGGKPDRTSPAGAIGYMQVMPDTWNQIKTETHGDATDGNKDGVSDQQNLWDGISAGTYYFSQQVKTFDSIDLALAAYNAGPGVIQQYHGIPPGSGYDETRNYVPSVLKLYADYQKCLTQTQTGLTGAEWCWPTSPTIKYISSPFHDPTRVPLHQGVDIAPPTNSNTSVIATQEGTVSATNDGCIVGDKTCGGGGYGNYVFIEHANGYTSRYGHMQQGSVQVSPGQKVVKGQKLGIIGTTGNSTGDHLHFEIRKNGDPIDPLPLIKECTASGTCDQSADKAVQFAIHQLGKNYISGGVGGWDASGFDCAGLFGSAWSWALNDSSWLHSGVPTFYTYNQLSYSPLTDVSQLRPGDGLFRGACDPAIPFPGDCNRYGNDSTVSPTHDYGHMSIYVGAVDANGQHYNHGVIQAGSSGGNVYIEEYNPDYWAAEFGRPKTCS